MFEKYDDIMTVEDVCDALKVSPSYAYKILKSGILKSFKIGGKEWRVTKNALIEYVNNKLNENSKKPKSKPAIFINN